MNSFDSSGKYLTKVKPLLEVFKELNITEQKYKNTLKFFDDNGYQLHFLGPTDL